MGVSIILISFHLNICKLQLCCYRTILKWHLHRTFPRIHLQLISPWKKKKKQFLKLATICRPIMHDPLSCKNHQPQLTRLKPFNQENPFLITFVGAKNQNPRGAWAITRYHRNRIALARRKWSRTNEVSWITKMITRTNRKARYII